MKLRVQWKQEFGDTPTQSRELMNRSTRLLNCNYKGIKKLTWQLLSNTKNYLCKNPTSWLPLAAVKSFMQPLSDKYAFQVHTNLKGKFYNQTN